MGEGKVILSPIVTELAALLFYAANENTPHRNKSFEESTEETKIKWVTIAKNAFVGLDKMNYKIIRKEEQKQQALTDAQYQEKLVEIIRTFMSEIKTLSYFPYKELAAKILSGGK